MRERVNVWDVVGLVPLALAVVIMLWLTFNRSCFG